MSTMNYYKIPTFEECLEIVEKEKAFSHSVQEMDGKEIHSFKYNLSYKEMWDDLEDGRINLRGITFIDGEIVALPFPKFFNLSENDYVRSENINLKRFDAATEKVDGSLLSFFLLNDRIEVKTMKSVYSDTAIEAREYLKDRPDVQEFARYCLDHSLSPIFEYVSPSDAARIVIDYGKKNFILLGARDIVTGTIYSVSNFPLKEKFPASIDMAQCFNTKDAFDAYMDNAEVEGVVITLDNGDMVKIKTKWYCGIHKLLDLFNMKNVLEMIVEGKSDDAKSQLELNGRVKESATIDRVEKSFLERYSIIEKELHDKFNEFKSKEFTKKDIAMGFMKENKPLASLVFKLYDDKDYSGQIKDMVFEEMKPLDLADF